MNLENKSNIISIATRTRKTKPTVPTRNFRAEVLDTVSRLNKADVLRADMNAFANRTAEHFEEMQIRVMQLEDRIFDLIHILNEVVTRLESK